MANVHDLRQRISNLQGPGVASAKSSAKLSSKLRAASAMRYALDVLRWSQRHAAAHLGVTERVVREWVEAGQQPAWIPLALPSAGQVEYFARLLDEVPPESKTGT
jgi:hypothetical protein